MVSVLSVWGNRLTGPRRGKKQQPVDPSIMGRTPCWPDKSQWVLSKGALVCPLTSFLMVSWQFWGYTCTLPSPREKQIPASLEQGLHFGLPLSKKIRERWGFIYAILVLAIPSLKQPKAMRSLDPEGGVLMLVKPRQAESSGEKWSLPTPRTNSSSTKHSPSLSCFHWPKPHTHTLGGWKLSSWPLFEAATLVILDLGCASESPGKLLWKTKENQSWTYPPLMRFWVNWPNLPKVAPKCSQGWDSLNLAHTHITALPFFS